MKLFPTMRLEYFISGLLLVSAGCSAQPSKPTTPKHTEDDHVSVTIDDDSVVVDGERIPFPATRAQMVAVLGEPDRSVEAQYNTVFVWDQSGIYAYSPPGRDFINEISFGFRHERHRFTPHTKFRGEIVFDNCTITQSTTMSTILECGFTRDPDWATSFIKQLGPNSILLHFDQEVIAFHLNAPEEPDDSENDN